jgi:hypothetical protein
MERKLLDQRTVFRVAGLVLIHVFIKGTGKFQSRKKWDFTERLDQDGSIVIKRQYKWFQVQRSPYRVIGLSPFIEPLNPEP